MDEQQDDHDTTDDIAIVRAIELSVPKEKRALWVSELGIPKELATLLKAIKLSVHSLVVYAITNNTAQNATDNINARLTSLEDFVGGQYGDAVRVDYPNIAIVLNKTAAGLEDLGTSQGLLSDSLPIIKDRMEDFMEQRNEDK
eukprot:15366519-Ditylum_brightwellii.AAC.1